MAYCLPREMASKFTQALKDGKIVPEDLAAMDSPTRRDFFSKIVGADEAKQVNAMFESKLLLKDYKSGLVTWAKRVSGISDIIRKDLVARIENLQQVLTPDSEKQFLADLVAQKLGVDVSVAEAKAIAERSQQVVEARGNWNKAQSDAISSADPLNHNAGWSSEADRLKYGAAVSDLRSFVTDLRNSKSSFSVKEAVAHPIDFAKQTFYKTFGITKSLLSSLDNSFFGRQGITTLYTHPTIWAKDFVKSWGDISKTIVGKDAMRAIEADVFSRPNAMNGKYQSAGLDVGIAFEEAFPTTFQDRLPIVGRAFKAADVAFTGGAMRMRADLADLLIPKAEEFGLSMTNGKDARAVGRLVNSMTGRGYIGGTSGNVFSSVFFSAKFLKSNFDTLTGHTLWQGDLTPEAKTFMRREAALNLTKVVLTTAFIMATIKATNPKGTSLDPRESLFGKLKVGATTIDFTGGKGSLVTLASRLVPTMHNGQWGWWSINSTGQFVNLHSGKYGQANPFDYLVDFASGKLSPAFGAFRDILVGQNYQGQTPNIVNTTTGLVTPLPIQTYFDLQSNPKSAPLLAGMLADILGFNTSTPPPKKK